ncbi:hypothetical protein VA7868_03237 [Vibrio aerogenes CECT 7868]|uniref:Porin n=1 Tax=Vibrio aerogenes CECT 7868 TaxID=1216006 RepID=A0A1M5ZUH9_9VIBR|nr:hypothetical protein [Vibrio aerogenes]SHI27798.1 hypothetical protein VA7868_03237 [Vibrio aerogenes CECT 7868]
MEIKKRVIATWIGLSLVSMGAVSGELKSLTSEVQQREFRDGSAHTEWTLGKGSYTINDDYRFWFDVDKDYFDNNDSANQDGWDTEFGIGQKVGELAGYDVTLNYIYRYDARWEHGNSNKGWNQGQYIFSPFLDKTVSLFGKEMDFGIELWTQVGTVDENSLQDISGWETNFYLSGDLSDSWNLSLALYNLNYYDKAEDEYDYQAGTENYLTYSLPLGAGFTFKIENYIEAYYTPDSEYTWVSAHIEPALHFKESFNEHVSFHAKVSYEVVDWEYNSVNNVTAYNDTSNNEMQVLIGIHVK